RYEQDHRRDEDFDEREPTAVAEVPREPPVDLHDVPHGQAVPTACTLIRPDGLTQMSSDPLADEFWTRTTPAAVAAPSELNVIVGPDVIGELFSSVLYRLASVSAPVKTLPPGQGTTVPEQDRIRLFGFV